MAKVFNAQALTAKWKKNYSQSGDAYKAGVQGVTVAPGVQAANAADKYAAKVQEAVDSGRYQSAVASVPLSQWQQQCTTVGVQRMASGAGKGEQKMNNYLSAAAPVYQDIAATAASMPNNGTDSDALAIMAMTLQKMRTLKGAGKRR